MYAAHFAAGLVVKGHAPKAPTWALLTGASLCDFLWIAFASVGIEHTQPNQFFDDWSHSLAMTFVWAVLFALCFWRLGRGVMLSIAIAGLSHFLLDMSIHPKPLALFPHSSVHLGWFFSGSLEEQRYWWAQFCVLLVLGIAYVHRRRKQQQPVNLVAATCVILLTLHLVMFPALVSADKRPAGRFSEQVLRERQILAIDDRL